MKDSNGAKKQLAVNTVILTIGKLCTQGVSFLLLPLYTTILSSNEQGIFDLFNTYVVLLLPLVNWEFDLGMFRFLLDTKGEFQSQRKVFSTVISVNIVQSLAYIILFALVSPFIKSEYRIFLAIDVLLNVFFNALLQFSRGMNKNTVYTFTSFIAASLTVVFNVITITALRWGVFGMFISPVVAKIMALAFVFIKMKAWRYFSFALYNKNLFKNISKYALPLIPTQLSWWIVNASDRTIVSYFLGLGANGIYAVSNKFSALFITFYNIFNMAWTETCVLHRDDENRDEFFSGLFNTVYAIFTAGCFVIMAFMPYIFPLMVKGDYQSGYNHVPILMIAALCQVVCGLYSVFYLAFKKTKESAKTSFLAAVVNISVNLALIKFVGLYAASISTLVAYLSMAIYRAFDSKKYINMKFNKKLLISSLCIGLLNFTLVIINNELMNLINLMIVIVYAIYINKNFIISILNFLKKKFKRA
ncbi:MAG: lipopolysaccharide biosynthesis protein [Ruminococcus sp.]|nr:lipopolysaccharide biosynthesis protein [Ruminococcus sp.]